MDDADAEIEGEMEMGIGVGMEMETDTLLYTGLGPELRCRWDEYKLASRQGSRLTSTCVMLPSF